MIPPGCIGKAVILVSRALFELYPFSAVGIQTGSIEYGHVEIFRLIKIEAINAGVRG